MKKTKRTDYTCEIVYCNQELTAKQRIAIKDVSDAIKLDEMLNAEDAVIIKTDIYAALAIHNEKSKMDGNVDYNMYIFIDDNGVKYATGSDSFWESFTDIADEMEGETEEWAVKAFRKPSSNYKDKYFITCTII